MTKPSNPRLLSRRQLVTRACAFSSVGMLVGLFTGRKLFGRRHRIPTLSQPPDLSGLTLMPHRSEHGLLTLHSNGLPTHVTGPFPNATCPFPIRSHHLELKFAAAPKELAYPTSVGSWLFGIAINGVPFHPAGPKLEKNHQVWSFEVLSPSVMTHLGIDPNFAHVQPGGHYHYHGVPIALVNSALESQRKRREEFHMIFLGWAADGFPIYAPYGHLEPRDNGSPLVQVRSSYRLKPGKRPHGGPGGFHDGTFTEDFEFIAGAGDLDACNGRFGVTPQYPGGIYHYFVTYEFPYISRFWRGAPDSSFRRGGPRPNDVPPGLRGFHG